MNPRRPFARAIAIVALIASIIFIIPDRLAATDASTSPYTGIANELAVKFLQGDATAETDLPAFLDTEEITGTKFKAAVIDAVKTGRKLVADGVPARSKPFARLLAAGPSRYLILANELALKFLRGPATEAANLAAFVREEEVAGGKFMATLTDVVETGQKLVAENDRNFAKSKYFPRLLATATEAPEPGKTEAASSTPTVNPAPLPPPAAIEVTEVLKADQNEYAGLKIAERELNDRIKALPEKAQADKPTDSQTGLNTAIDLKRSEFTDALHENVMQQNLVLARAARSKAATTVTAFKLKSDPQSADDRKVLDQLTAVAAANQVAEDAAAASLSALRSDIEKKRGAPAAQQQQYAELQVKAAALDHDIRAQNVILAENKGQTPAETVRYQAAEAKLQADQDNLNATHVTQQKLRHLYLQESATAAKLLAPPADAAMQQKAQIALDKANRKVAADTASDRALQKQIAAQVADPKRTPFAFTHGGLRMLSPYNISDQMGPDPADSTKTIPTGHKIVSSSGSTQVAGFIEFVYTNVWAWKPGRQDRTDMDSRQRVSILPLIGNSWDTLGRVSFNFAQGSQPSASAITGSGDFNAEITFDKHLFRGWLGTDDKMAYSGSLSVSAGGVTDRGNLKVHPRLFAGTSLALSFDDPWSAALPNPRRVWYRMQGGLAQIDTLNFDKNFPDTRIIEVNHGDLPSYSPKWAPALEAELFWPLRDYALISIGARLYVSRQPAPWSLYLGVTVPLTGLADSLTPK